MSIFSLYIILARLNSMISIKGTSRLKMSQRSIIFTYAVLGNASEMLMNRVVSTRRVVTLTVTFALKSLG